ncbi:S8 family serine peptidase, partial [Bacillus safensis]|uniref:S8 family peptidase n=2 Tax=Bacillaceae TaxID=186817 RepID=UPI002FFFC5FC
VLDSGINKNHKDLKGKVVKEFNPIDSSIEFENKLSHGTSIAGIITANNTDSEVTGVTQNVELYSVKVIKNDGKIERQGFLDGFKWAISQNVDIINLSLGFQKDFPELRELVDDAVKKGIIIVAASGNTYGLNSQFPARYDNVISVGAIDSKNKVPQFSAIGKVDFFAPGVNVLSLNNKGENSVYTGSSYSTAYITGVIADYLYKEKINKDEKSFSQVYTYLESSSTEMLDNKSKIIQDFNFKK